MRHYLKVKNNSLTTPLFFLELCNLYVMYVTQQGNKGGIFFIIRVGNVYMLLKTAQGIIEH